MSTEIRELRSVAMMTTQRVQLVEERFDEDRRRWVVNAIVDNVITKIYIDCPENKEKENDILWYVESYAQQDPYAGARAACIKQDLRERGESLARLLLPLLTASHATLHYNSIVLDIIGCGEHSKFHALQWEILEDLVLWGETLPPVIVRRAVRLMAHPSMALKTPTKFRILFVTARPSLESDRPYLLVSLPILRLIRGRRIPHISVEFTFATPATWDMFCRAIKEQFDLVHFDMHGRVGRKGPELGFSRLGQSNGRPRWVPAKDIACKLREHNVSRAVINACESAKSSPSFFSNLGYHFVQAGVQEVIGMTTSATEDIVSNFITQLYYEFFVHHRNLSYAAAIARAHLRQFSTRHGRFAKQVDIYDFFVPSIIVKESLEVPSNGCNLTSTCGQLHPDIGTNLAPEKSENLGVLTEFLEKPFIGRDSEVLILEEALNLNGIVSISAPCGQGKTHLAMWGIEWWLQTGFIELHMYSDCHKTINLARKLTSLFAQICKSQHQSGLSPAEQIDYVHSQNCLIVLDNFEPALLSPSSDMPREWLDVDQELRSTLERFNEPQSKARILILRSCGDPFEESQWPRGMPVICERLQPLDEKAAGLLLGQITSWSSLPSRDQLHQRRALQELLEHFEYNPLSIKLLTSTLHTVVQNEDLLERMQFDILDSLHDSLQTAIREAEALFKPSKQMPCLDTAEGRTISSTLHVFWQRMNALKDKSPTALEAVLSLAPFRKRIHFPYVRFSASSTVHDRLQHESEVLFALNWGKLMIQDSNTGRIGQKSFKMHPLLPFLLLTYLRRVHPESYWQKLDSYREDFVNFYETRFEAATFETLSPEIQSIVIRTDIDNILNAISLAATQRERYFGAVSCVTAILPHFDLMTRLHDCQRRRIIKVLNAFFVQLEEKLQTVEQSGITSSLLLVLELSLRGLVFIFQSRDQVQVPLPTTAALLSRSESMLALCEHWCLDNDCISTFRLWLRSQELLSGSILSQEDWAMVSELFASRQPRSESPWLELFIGTQIDLMDRLLRCVQEEYLQIPELETFISRTRDKLLLATNDDVKLKELCELRMSRWNANSDHASWVAQSKAILTTYLKPGSRKWLSTVQRRAALQTPTIEMAAVIDLPTVYSALEINQDSQDLNGEVYNRYILFKLELDNMNYDAAVQHHQRLATLEDALSMSDGPAAAAAMAALRCGHLGQMVCKNFTMDVRPEDYDTAKSWFLQARDWCQKADNCSEQLYEYTISIATTEMKVGKEHEMFGSLAVAAKCDVSTTRDEEPTSRGRFLWRFGSALLRLSNNYQTSDDAVNEMLMNTAAPLGWHPKLLSSYIIFCHQWLQTKGHDWPIGNKWLDVPDLNDFRKFFYNAQHFLVKLDPTVSQGFFIRYMPRDLTGGGWNIFLQRLESFGNKLSAIETDEIESVCSTLLMDADRF